MRRVIITEFSNLSEKLSNQCIIFSFQLQNLCIKAEPASLLAIKVDIDGESKNLEDCAAIGKGDDDYTFKIIPLFEEDLPKISLAIKKAHPEFKQDIEEMQIDDVDMASVMISEDVNDAKKVRNLPYLLLTMPVVNDNRYDLLNDAVKLCYDECKLRNFWRRRTIRKSWMALWRRSRQRQMDSVNKSTTTSCRKSRQPIASGQRSISLIHRDWSCRIS